MESIVRLFWGFRLVVRVLRKRIVLVSRRQNPRRPTGLISRLSERAKLASAFKPRTPPGDGEETQVLSCLCACLSVRVFACHVTRTCTMFLMKEEDSLSLPRERPSLSPSTPSFSSSTFQTWSEFLEGCPLMSWKPLYHEE
ncbi:hypothetical protein AOLI_G00200980 [Acnodon oligacanthus]